MRSLQDSGSILMRAVASFMDVVSKCSRRWQGFLRSCHGVGVRGPCNVVDEHIVLASRYARNPARRASEACPWTHDTVPFWSHVNV